MCGVANRRIACIKHFSCHIVFPLKWYQIMNIFHIFIILIYITLTHTTCTIILEIENRKEFWHVLYIHKTFIRFIQLWLTALREIRWTLHTSPGWEVSLYGSKFQFRRLTRSVDCLSVIQINLSVLIQI